MAINRCLGECAHDYSACTGRVTSYEGAVLSKYERNGSNDSDFVALVWDEDKEAVLSIEYASTRFWTYHNHAAVDATEDVLAKAEAWLAESYRRVGEYEAEQQRHLPLVGRKVRSTTTRGKNVGLVGTVGWHGKDSYRSRHGVTFYRVGVRVEGETELRFLPAEKVEVLDPAPVDHAAIAATAVQRATGRRFREAFYPG